MGVRRPYINPYWPVTKGTGPHTPWRYRYVSDLYTRLQMQKPEEHSEKRRFFNFDAELFACSRRLLGSGPLTLPAELLRQAFTDAAYAQEELIKRREMLFPGQDGTTEGDSSTSERDTSNTELAQAGRDLLKRYIQTALNTWYPRMPQDCIRQIMDFYCSAEFNAKLARSLGFESLVRSFPSVTEQAMSRAMWAYLRTIELSSNRTEAEKFIKDIYLHSYVDVNELLTFDNKEPIEYLRSLMVKDDLEPRILWSTGVSTLLSCYVVGIYGNHQKARQTKVLLGQSAGRTVDEALQMAAKDCLRNLFQSFEHRAPISLV